MKMSIVRVLLTAYFIIGTAYAFPETAAPIKEVGKGRESGLYVNPTEAQILPRPNVPNSAQPETASNEKARQERLQKCAVLKEKYNRQSEACKQ